MLSPRLTDPRDPRDPRYALNACSLRAGTTSIRARWKRPIFRRRFAKVHASLRTQSPVSNIQYQISYHICIYIYMYVYIYTVIYTYHKSKCIIISSYIFSCFIMLCDILSYIVMYCQLYIINGLIQHQNDRRPCVFAHFGGGVRFPSAKLWDCVQSS